MSIRQTTLLKTELLEKHKNALSNRVIRAILSKPFCILTGGSGTGKSHLATSLAEWLTGSSKPKENLDAFAKGIQVASDRISYLVASSDQLAVEFWNNDAESQAIKVVLPRAIIDEWINSIIANKFDDRTPARTIRESIQNSSQFSNNLHSFETHLKAAAFHKIKHAAANEYSPQSCSTGDLEVVAVGADWTDNRSVLGFVNHLNSNENRPYYQSTPFLDLLLRANDSPEVPYFLILDEMNLSHVERYFSDFLSVMEQTDGVLKLHSENGNLKRAGKDEADVPPQLPYPANLFVIGTVNIDETTYMFSPKVLDRANVIEFTVSEEEIDTFLKDPQPYPEIEPAAPGVAEDFLALAKEAHDMKLDALPQVPKEAIAAHLLSLFKILKAGRFEFAYRTAKEVNTYLRVCRHLSLDSDVWDGGEWKKDLDDQILQKLLPKLHGSMGRIGGLLATLANYCHSGEYKEPDLETGASQQNQSRNQLEVATKLTSEGAKFPRSLEKLQSMIQTLRDEQFVSFIQ